MFDEDWVLLDDRHKAYVAAAQRGEAKIVFYGDSLTEGFRDVPAWERLRARGASAFGIGGDTTWGLLKRLEDGEMGNLKPDTIFLLIGVNNLGLGTYPPVEVADNICMIARLLKKTMPDSRLVVQGLFPAGQSPSDPFRTMISQVNQIVSAAAPKDGFDFEDFGERFLMPDGSISAGIMPDFLHLSEAGYEIWARAVEEILS